MGWNVRDAMRIFTELDGHPPSGQAVTIARYIEKNPHGPKTTAEPLSTEWWTDIENDYSAALPMLSSRLPTPVYEIVDAILRGNADPLTGQGYLFTS